MNNFPDGLLWFPDSLSGKGKQASGAFPAAWDFFPRSQFVMDEAGAIQYKDKMHIDWLNDFLEWTPILLMVLVAVVFLVALKWRSGRMKKFLEEWKRKIVRQAEAGNPSAQFRLGRIYQEGDGVEKDPDRAEDWFHRALPLLLFLLYGRTFWGTGGFHYACWMVTVYPASSSRAMASSAVFW